jgi:hypothetical protein
VLEALFEFLFQVVIEILWQILFEVATSFGWESIDHSMRTERKADPVLAGLGHLLMGLVAGVISLFILPGRLVPRSPLPGISLVLSPLGTGLAMHLIGELWRERGKDRPKLFSFWAGAIFAFGMALVRFLYLEAL